MLPINVTTWATSKTWTWTRTLKNLDTLKNMNPEKHGINMGLKICLTLESYVR